MTRKIEALFQREAYPIEGHAGRDIGAGHLRGWGLEYGGLLEQHIAGEPLFEQALRAARERGSLLTLHKLANLYMVIRYAMSEEAGDIYEFGSFMGGSAVFMGTLLKGLGRRARVYAFDTYEGMPATDAVRDLHSKGDFSDTGYAGLLDYIQDAGLSDHVRTVKGEFGATLPGVLAQDGSVGLAHVDCDIYGPIKQVVRACLPRMTAGAHVVFDDPLHGSCLGAFDAVQELMIRELGLTAEQAYPHLVFRCPPLVAP